jgi:hypothetical protein
LRDLLERIVVSIGPCLPFAGISPDDGEVAKTLMIQMRS